MSGEQENIFSVPHSLPSSAHPIALATRTPSNLVKVDSTKFMPDYGGCLEVPGTNSKQYGLRKGVPFHFDPLCAILVNKYFRPKPTKEEPPSVVVTSYLDPGANSNQSPISAFKSLGKTLYCDVFHPFVDENKVEIESRTCTHIPYPFQITGLKYHDTKDRYLIVESRNGCKLMRMNPYYDVPDLYRTPTSSDTEEDEPKARRYISDKPVFEFEAGFPERRGVTCVDACLPTNQRIFAMLGNDSGKMYIKLYDLEHSKKLFGSLVRDRVGIQRIVGSSSQENAVNRKKSLRSFVPIHQPLESIQSLEFDPYHLVDMVVTTSDRVSLVDIRENAIQHNYVDRIKMLSVLPTEQFKQVVFSKTCDQQFYMLSSEKIRVFDKRYLSQTMCSVDHMLGPHDYEMMKMKLVKFDQGEVESLCISRYGRLCFTSFDRGRRSQSLVENSGRLINPISLHAPIHKPRDFEGPNKPSTELYGLDISSLKFFPNDNTAFSVYQITRIGDICVKGFQRATENHLQVVKHQTQAQLILQQHKSEANEPEEDLSFYENEYQPGSNRNLQTELPFENCLDVLDVTPIAMAEQRLTSKRAIEKYNLMKKKLHKH